MGFSPLVLCQLDQNEANLIVSRCIGEFSWIIAFFYGEHIEKSPASINKIKSSIPDLASISNEKILFLDFLPSNEEVRAYLYSKWREQCPSQISNQSISLMQQCFELGLTDQKRIVLEQLFYQSVFQNTEEFLPCLLVINTRYKYLVKRNFMRHDLDSNLLESVLTGISIIESQNEEFFCNKLKIAEFLKPNGFTNRDSIVSSSLACNLDVAIANFLDNAEDLLLSVDPKITGNLSIFEGLKTTKKFEESFSMLEDHIKRLAEKAISNLISGSFSGIKLKKITLSNQISFYRMRINEKYRIHFQGTPNEPIFINIGSHKLYEFGYVID